MRGRKPKPSKLKLIEGNRGKRPLPKKEPKPPISEKCPLTPRWLCPEAKKEWKRLAPELHRMKLLTQFDLAALAGYCTAVARLIEAQHELIEADRMIKGARGTPIMNPWLRVENMAQQEIRKWGAEFGFTPSARARIQAEPDELTSIEDLIT